MRTRCQGHRRVIRVQSAHILCLHKLVSIPVSATKVTPAMTALQGAETVQARMNRIAMNASIVQTILTKTQQVTVSVCRVQQTAGPDTTSRITLPVSTADVKRDTNLTRSTLSGNFRMIQTIARVYRVLMAA